MFLPGCCLTKHVGLYFGVCTFLPPYLGSWILPAAAAVVAAQRLRSFIHIPHKLHSDFEIAAAAGRAQKADILKARLGADCMMVDSLQVQKDNCIRRNLWPIVEVPPVMHEELGGKPNLSKQCYENTYLPFFRSEH